MKKVSASGSGHVRIVDMPWDMRGVCQAKSSCIRLGGSWGATEGLRFKSHNVSQDGFEESQLYSQRLQGGEPLTHLHTYTTFTLRCPLTGRFPPPAPLLPGFQST